MTRKNIIIGIALVTCLVAVVGISLFKAKKPFSGISDPNRLTANATHTAVAVSKYADASSTQVLAGNTARKHVTCVNGSGNDMKLWKTSATSTDWDQGLLLKANGGVFTLDETELYLGMVRMSATTTTSTVSCAEQ